MNDFLDSVERGIEVATNVMGEPFTIGSTTYGSGGVFSAIDSSVDYESLSGYDTTDTCGLSVHKGVISTELAINTEIVRQDTSTWIVVESSTADENNYDYVLRRKES